MKQSLNYIILSDGEQCYLFERIGVPFEAYNKNNAIVTGKNEIDLLENLKTLKSNARKVYLPENLKSISLKNSESRIPNLWEVEHKVHEVIFNES